MHVFSTLAPVFLIIALGAVLRRSGFMPPEIVGGMNRLTFWVALPALLFHEIVASRAPGSFFGRPFIAVIAVMLATIAAAYAVAPLCRVPRAARGTFAQAAFRGNLAFVGLPVVVFAADGRHSTAATTAVYLLASVVPFYNIAAVLVLVTRGKGLQAMQTMVRQLLTNPLILSCAAGAGWTLTGRALPLWCDRTLSALADMALPLALLGIGATLRLEGVRGHWTAIAAAGALKVLVGPLAGWALARWLALSPAETLAVLIFLATPTATATFVMADQLGGDRGLAAGAVAVSTLLSIAPLWAILAWF